MSQNVLVAAAEPPLTALAQRANDAHSAFGRGSTDAVTYAIEAGTALREAKQRVAFGEWLPWLAEHVEFSERTAQLYMQLAAHPPAADPQRVAGLSLRAAAKALATPRASAGQPAAAVATGRESAVIAAGHEGAAGSREPPPVARAGAVPCSRLNADRIARVRRVLEAIDSVLERAETEELSDAAAAGLLREAASGTRAALSELEAFAAELSGRLPAPRSACPRPADV